VTSDRGALQIKFDIDEVKLICYEDVSSKGWAWNHGIAACLPESKSSMGNRSVLTKLGTDENALRSDAKDHVLFDMGLGAPHVDFCVRTNDPYLIDILTRAEGKIFCLSFNEMTFLFRHEYIREQRGRHGHRSQESQSHCDNCHGSY
jgi:hypothetical protein